VILPYEVTDMVGSMSLLADLMGKKG